MAVKFDFASLDQPFEADWPVVVSVPTEDGAIEEQRFSARFRLLRQADYDDIAKTDIDGHETFRRFFVGFGRTEEQTFTPDLFEKLVTTSYVRNALLGAYTRFAAGIPEKN